MKPKKKEDQNVDASVLFRKVNKILTGGNLETKWGAETEGKAIQRLLPLGIHPIYSHQTQMSLNRGMDTEKYGTFTQRNTIQLLKIMTS